ncbi:hypothetical protein HEK616_30430 [Streptomyces nigrescens]|uniref:Amidohydrolase 3 domain-containing protein n=1 Tax=Streptomyces nigrescens TaxID=1920 RepID=A0ABM7ZT54_STRNI|nr:hypothetical protein HEK616_30430 [Streptomyces nigrescens]
MRSAVSRRVSSVRRKERGSLTVGKLADFVVLSRDILRAAPQDIPGTIAETVVVGGDIVHQR